MEDTAAVMTKKRDGLNMRACLAKRGNEREKITDLHYLIFSWRVSRHAATRHGCCRGTPQHVPRHFATCRGMSRQAATRRVRIRVRVRVSDTPRDTPRNTRRDTPWGVATRATKKSNNVHWALRGISTVRFVYIRTAENIV